MFSHRQTLYILCALGGIIGGIWLFNTYDGFYSVSDPSAQLRSKASLPDSSPSDQVAIEGPTVEKMGRLAVIAASSTGRTSEPMEFKIELDTGDRIIQGFDAILIFNPNDWDAQSSQVSTNPDSLFSQFPVNLIDNREGRIELSGISELDSPFQGTVTLGSFLLQPKHSGTLDVRLLWEGSNQPNDSNLAQVGSIEDALSEVTDAIVVVQE